MSTPTLCNGIHHIAFKAHDFDASLAFYTRGLGLPVRLAWGEGDARAVMLDTGNGNYIEIFAGGSAEGKPEGTLLHFALCTDDCDAALQRAADAGAKITMVPTSLVIDSEPPTPVRIAFCTGPDGEVIEFFQSR